MRIVWIRQAANSPADRPDYRRVNWRPINWVRCAELDSYDIRGLSAMITRSIRHESIRYILGSTGEGRQLLRINPNTPLSWVNYTFIDNDEAVRAWLLSNPVLEDPLDLLIYCHRVPRKGRAPTPALRGHDYLVPGAVTNWPQEAITQAQFPGGSQQPEAGQPEARADPWWAYEAGEPQEGDASDAILAALSSASSHAPALGIEARGALGCCHPSVEREGNPERNIYP